MNLNLQSIKQIPWLKNWFWRLRKALGITPRYKSEVLFWLLRLPDIPQDGKTGLFRFPWGQFEYVNAVQLTSQFKDIFISNQYRFSSESPDPIIVDCGGNVGLSAVWFKLNYPRCKLTVYEADPDLARVLKANLFNAGFDDVLVFPDAVWIANETIAFNKTGNDSGRIVSQGETFYPAVDLSEHLPEHVDLLKLDIEGAEFPVLERLCDTGSIQRVQRLICEFHVWRDKTDDLLKTLALIRASGMQFSLSALAVPWIGLAEENAPFEVIQRNNVCMEVYAWRTECERA